MNFLGLGFSFGAKDGGLNPFLKKTIGLSDQVAEGIRNFGRSAEKSTAPVADFMQSLGAKTFNGLANGLEGVTSIMEKSVFSVAVSGAKAIQRSEKTYAAAGDEIGLSFDNIKRSVTGLYQQLVGNRLTKFGEQLPTKRFQEMADRMHTTMGVAKSFLGEIFGTKKGVDELSGSLDTGIQMVDHFGNDIKPTTGEMASVDKEVKQLAKSIGSTLPKDARVGADKFKRSADSVGGTQNTIARGFDLMKKGVSSLNDILSVNKLQAFLQAVNIQKIGEIGQGLAHIGTEGGQLTTSFEAASQAASVSSRKVIAATGIFGKALTDATAKAAGLSMGMKVSEQTSGHAVASMQQFGGELKAFGIDSAETGIKLEDGLGVPIRDLGFNVHKMRDGLHLSDKDLAEVAKSFTATGESIHDMVHPLQNMPELLDLATRRSNLVASGMSSIGGKESIKSINRATQALFVLTGDSKKAQEGAVALETKMTESMEGFQHMFSGNSTQLDAFLVNTSVVTGDVKQAFKAAAQGPDAFIKEFGGVIAKLKKDGKSTSDILQFFGGQMSEALGPDLANTLVNALSNADAAKMKMIGGLKDTGKALGDVAKESWRSSMTLQESFDLMMGSAESNFRQIGMAATHTFVKQTGVAFDHFNAKAQALVKEGGPLGMLVEKMSLISTIGAKALLPEALRPMAQIFGHLSPMVFQAVSAFTALGPMVMGLVNPFTLLAGAVGLIYLGFKQAEKSMKGGKKAFADLLGNKVKGYITKAHALADAVPGIVKEIAEDFQLLKTAIPWEDIWTSVAEAAEKAWSAVKDMASGVIEGFFDGVDPATSEGKGMSAKLGAQLGDLLRKGFDFAKDELGKYLKSWWQNMGSIWEDDWMPFGEKVGKTATGSAGILIAAFAAGKFTPVFKVVGVLGDMMGPLSSALGTIVEMGAGLLGVPAAAVVATAAVLALVAVFVAWPEEANAAVGKVSKYIHDAVSTAAEYATTWFIDTVIKGWRTFPGKLVDVVFRTVKGLGDVLDIMPKWIASIIDGIIDGVHNAFAKAFPEYKEAIDSMFDVLKDFASAGMVVLRAFLNPIGTIIDGFKLVGAAASYIWDGIKGVWDNIKGFFKWLYDTVDDAFLHSWFPDAFGAAFGKITGMFNGFGDLVGKIFDGLKGLVSSALSPVTEIFDKVFGDGPKSAPDQINDGLTDGFSSAFKTSLSDTKLFAKKEEDIFLEMTKAITDAFKSMWHTTLEDASEAVENGLKPTIGSAMEDLRQLQTAVEALKDVRAAVAKGEAEKRQTAEGKGGAPTSMAGSVTMGIGDWWATTGRDDYQSGVKEIVSAINGIKVGSTVAAPAGGNSAAGRLANSAQFTVQKGVPLSPATALGAKSP